MGVERRSNRAQGAAPTTLHAAIWPFRLVAVIAGLVRGAEDIGDGNLLIIATAAALMIYAMVSSLKPVAYRNDSRVRLRIVAEMAFHTVVILLTGAWQSPFTQVLIPTCMLAGFAAGSLFAGQLSLAVIAAVGIQHLDQAGPRVGIRDTLLWTGWLALISFTSGLAYRAAVDAAQQQRVAFDRVSRLAEANSLLFSLQRVAQTLPASLDLDEVLDSTVARVRSMIPNDAFVVYALDGARFAPLRTFGSFRPPSLGAQQLPAPLRDALDNPKPIHRDDLRGENGVAADARSGLYCSLRARGSVVGLMAIESHTSNHFTQQDSEVLHGLSEPFGIAIDNARMFRQIRTLAADEERTRIARELHDQIGSSLAMVGFEVDRAASLAGDDSAVRPILTELRQQITTMIGDVRDALYDLRTEVSEAVDIGTVLREFSERVGERSGFGTRCSVRIDGRVALTTEREVWQIAREAILNVERHARASVCDITCQQTASRLDVTISDDGIGIDPAAQRIDSYGMRGMRERAERIGAALTVVNQPRGGTQVRVVVIARTSTESARTERA
jgi:signal transduction histidine kinase